MDRDDCLLHHRMILIHTLNEPLIMHCFGGLVGLAFCRGAALTLPTLLPGQAVLEQVENIAEGP